MDIRSLPPEIYQYCIESVYPPRKVWQVDHFELIEKPGMYGTNNGVVAFIDESGRRFESPFTTRVTEILEQSGYQNNGLVGVPLSNPLRDEDVPAPSYVDRWELMVTAAQEEEQKIALQQEEAYIQQIAAQKQLGLIEPSVLQTTVALPKTGIAVSQQGVAPVDKVMPIGLGDMQQLMGTYSENNGHLIFVDQNGQSRVSESTPELTSALGQAGYHPSSMGVPVDDWVEFVTEPRAGVYIEDTVLQATRDFQQQWLVAKHIVEERKQLANAWDYQPTGGMSR